jgi:peptidoglycan/xylan/chitin deacetylase (PgdA/CDA1 family)
LVFHDVPDRAWFERYVDEICFSRKVLPLGELARDPTRRKVCSITFDDGRKSIWDVAHPVLSERRIPYTIFVCTDAISGGPVPWFLRADHLINHVDLEIVKQQWNLGELELVGAAEVIAVLKEVPLDLLEQGLGQLERAHAIKPPDPRDQFLSAQQVAVLSKEGVEIGSHSHRHPILSKLSFEDQLLEIETSVRLIETLVGRSPTQFAYPNGSPLDFDKNTMSILEARGFELAVTTTQRHLRPDDDLLRLPRMGVESGDSSTHITLKHLAPWLSRGQAREERLRSRVGEPTTAT